MRPLAAVRLPSLVWTGCSSADPPRPRLVEPGSEFSLRAGESVQTADGALRLGFAGHTLQLVRLNPYPVDGRAMAREAHAETLVLTRGAAARPWPHLRSRKTRRHGTGAARSRPR